MSDQVALFTDAALDTPEVVIDLETVRRNIDRAAVSLPLHWTDDGLPIGVQFAGRPFAEATLLRLAAQLERDRPWGGRRPPIS